MVEPNQTSCGWHDPDAVHRLRRDTAARQVANRLGVPLAEVAVTERRHGTHVVYTAHWVPEGAA